VCSAKAIFEDDCTHNVVRYAALTHPTAVTQVKCFIRKLRKLRKLRELRELREIGRKHSFRWVTALR